jgi:hypothetical protein
VGQGLVRSFLAPCLVLTGSLRLTRDVSDVLGSDKPAANALIGAWRAFMQNSVAAHALAGVARKEGLAGAFMSFSLHHAFALTRYCLATGGCSGLVADAQTYAAASKAVRLLLDQNFHTIKARHHAVYNFSSWLLASSYNDLDLSTQHCRCFAARISFCSTGCACSTPNACLSPNRTWSADAMRVRAAS